MTYSSIPLLSEHTVSRNSSIRTHRLFCRQKIFLERLVVHFEFLGKTEGKDVNVSKIRLDCWVG